ncbi:acylneuraminate cytidylyltransferase family protein [Sporolactobacillus shoreae]|uniref:Acylneuraminate cytidylyltransferase family protein n=1 Tax=Sporolactobacillus shoreae TaxID=1465501 RepID=A0A4Z0GKP3_9BACL|nr:acylneuraminate cytidylyltransferase family protein [Sporolactobacillus shoreae]TGA97411.1 acylneuraminate cytidylyltransferase family protein [Sporolactobacillus shoreae]
MYNGENILAIIPARGGSKGIPHKNIVEICGQPLIAYSINEAKKSSYIDKLIISTEDEEIAKIGEKFGAEVPFMRPQALAQDSTPGIDPILHAMDWFRQRGIVYNYVMCLQCTSPLRTVNQIDEAIKQLIDQGADSIVSVCESKVSPFWMKRINEGVLADFLTNAPFYARRQEAPTVYQLNGALYLAREEILRTNKNWYTKQTLPYIMDEISSLDIDSQTDLQFFEFLEGRKRK